MQVLKYISASDPDKMWVTKYIILLLILVSATNSAKILGVFPMPSKSHLILGSALLKELAHRGHEVTMISPFPLKEPLKNYRDIELTDIVKASEEMMANLFSPNTTIIDLFKMILSAPGLGVTSALNDNSMKHFLNLNEKYDVVILDYGLSEALLGIGYNVGGPTIAMSVAGSNPFTNYLLNIPAPISYVPNIFLPYTDDMTFFQRTINTLVTLIFDQIYKYVGLSTQRNILKQYFPDAPPLEDLMEDIDIVLSCSHFTTESLRPTFQNIITIGGFHLYEEQNLSKEFQNYLDNSPNGVILFSLGSNVKSENMPPGAEDILLKAFGKLPYNFIWKTNAKFVDIPKNVKITKWVPQRAVLAHPNVKAFITHGGLGGTSEAIFNGVPMIGMPFVADQYKNVAECERKGILYKVDPNKITEEEILKGINEVINNPVYKQKMEYQSDLYKNLEINPMDRAVFWVEHVIKHKGAKHLKSRASKIPFYQYYLLDVTSFILLILLLILFIIWSVFKCLLNSCCRKQKIKIS